MRAYSINVLEVEKKHGDFCSFIHLSMKILYLCAITVIKWRMPDDVNINDCNFFKYCVHSDDEDSDGNGVKWMLVV